MSLRGLLLVLLLMMVLLGVPMLYLASLVPAVK